MIHEYKSLNQNMKPTKTGYKNKSTSTIGSSMLCLNMEVRNGCQHCKGSHALCLDMVNSLSFVSQRHTGSESQRRLGCKIV